MITSHRQPHASASPAAHQPIVDDLITLLQSRPDLAVALEESIRRAGRPEVENLRQYHAFLDAMVTLIPTDRNLNSHILNFYYLIDQSPADLLQEDAAFQDWSRRFAAEWGAFLDTPASAAGIDRFQDDPSYHLPDYFVGPSGWLTFNQFFARQVRPGKRPVDDRCDDLVVVSPADSVFQGHWPIAEDSKITVKGLTWSVLDLLAGSPWRDAFKGGVFTHSFLNVNDYHWFHVPVGGVVREVRKIPGRVTMDVVKQPDGSLGIVDGTGYQFSQDRGLIVIDSPLGLVAVLPIGMAQVSSVNLTAEPGAAVVKGEEFGFFAFGGSDIVTLFEAGKVQLEAEIGTHYNQGRRIGRGISGAATGAVRGSVSMMTHDSSESAPRTKGPETVPAAPEPAGQRLEVRAALTQFDFQLGALPAGPGRQRQRGPSAEIPGERGA